MTLGFIPDAPAAPATAAPPAGAAPAGGARPVNLQFVPDPAPQSWTDLALSNAEAGGKLLGRTGVNLAASLPNLLVGGSEAIGAGLNKLGVPNTGPTPTLYDNNGQQLTGPGAAPRPSPGQEIINATGLQMDPDASNAMKVADYVLPFLVSGGRGAFSRVGEAEGVVNKTAEGLGYLTGAGLDAAGSYYGGKAGDWIGGPTGAFIGSLLGGGVRTPIQRLFGYGSEKTVGSPEGGAIFDAMTSQEGPNTFPAFGQVTGDTGKRVEKAIGSVPILNLGVNAARNAAEAGIERSVATGVGEVGDRAPAPGPVDKDVTGARIISAAQQANKGQQAALSAEQQRLEDAIGRGTPADVSPLVQQMIQMSRAPDTGPNISRAIEPRIADVGEAIKRQNPPAGPPEAQTQPYPPTAAYGALKDLRGDLRARTQAADPLTGHYLGNAEDAYTAAMRAAADAKGQGAAFDTANLAYAKFKSEQQPWLEEQGGTGVPAGPTGTRFEGVPSTGHIAGQAEGIVGPTPSYLTDVQTNLGLPVARNTLADVISRLGQIRGAFSPSRFGTDYGGVNQQTKDFITQNAPSAENYLENAATGGRAFDIQPERPGLSKAAGWLGSLAEGIAKAPRLIGALGGGLETPSMIRAAAGRTDIPALLAQYAGRLGVGAGRQ